ncbi:MAG: hypothetical protein EAZ85_09920 [Bacteroidetes bacterium]|nr:MAG: hypothetical protein EAZ85_09920 [Bacteroidota bacterium]
MQHKSCCACWGKKRSSKVCSFVKKDNIKSDAPNSFTLTTQGNAKLSLFSLLTTPSLVILPKYFPLFLTVFFLSL